MSTRLNLRFRVCATQVHPVLFLPILVTFLLCLLLALTYRSRDAADVNCFNMSTEVQSPEETGAEAVAVRSGIARLKLENMLDIPTTFTISCRLYLYKVVVEQAA